MADLTRIRSLATIDRIESSLRDHLNAEITATIADLSSEGLEQLQGFAALEEPSVQIQTGDHPDYEPVRYPAVRIAFPLHEFRKVGSQTVSQGGLLFVLGIYVEAESATEHPDCMDETIRQLQRTAVAYIEAVRACVESRLPGNGIVKVEPQEYRRVEAPQVPDNPCILRQKYELIMEAGLRVRHSTGLALT